MRRPKVIRGIVWQVLDRRKECRACGLGDYRGSVTILWLFFVTILWLFFVTILWLFLAPNGVTDR
jgi:hypothetical protein